MKCYRLPEIPQNTTVIDSCNVVRVHWFQWPCAVSNAHCNELSIDCMALTVFIALQMCKANRMH